MPQFSRSEPDSRHAASTLFDELNAPGSELGSSSSQNQPGLTVCSLGALWRSLALVHLALGVVLLHGGGPLTHWWSQLAHATAVTVPSVLVWLLLCCWLRYWLVRLSLRARLLWIDSLAALATLAVWYPLLVLGLLPGSGPGFAIAASAAALAHLVQRWEDWRVRARLPAVAAARLADLQTRIRPHFLFNTLNTAIALVRHDPEMAEQVLEDLSELFRAALGGLDEATTLGAEIELSARYLAIERLRFGERLRVVWDLDPSANAALLPPLALQPLIENAVRHGVEIGQDGGDIEVRTLRRRDRVWVSITNSVPQGVAPRPGHGLGMASVRERLRLLHDLDADFRCGKIEDGRWRASLSLPA